MSPLICCYTEFRYVECHYDAELRYAEFRYTESHYAECHYTECRGAVRVTQWPMQ